MRYEMRVEGCKVDSDDEMNLVKTGHVCPPDYYHKDRISKSNEFIFNVM